MRVYTIGFTKKNARTFFGILRQANAKTLVDVRLNNVSQLSGFAKRDDLKYFLSELCAMDYVHETRLAPTQVMLDGYKKHGASWPDYEKQFLTLMGERRIEDTIAPEMVDNSVLLCSESEAHHCHRRLVAEYLAARWQGVSVTHL